MKRIRIFLQLIWESSPLKLLFDNELWNSDAHNIISRKGLRNLDKNDKANYIDEE